MRCSSVALKLVASAVPFTAVIFVWCALASAHAHRHSYRQVYAHGVHFAGHRLYSSTAYGSQYFASPLATGQSSFAGSGYARSASHDNVSTMAASQAGAAGLPASLVERVIHRESEQSARGACRQLRLDADPALDRAGDGLYRLGGGTARSTDQYDLRAALSRRRLSRRGRQREPRCRVLFPRLLQPGQDARLLALCLKHSADRGLEFWQLRPRIPNFIPNFIPARVADERLVGRTIRPEASPSLPRVIALPIERVGFQCRGVYSAATALTSIKNSSRTRRSMMSSVLGG